MSEIEAKLRKLHMPVFNNIFVQYNWELHACNEPYLQDYSKETAAGLVIWSKPGTGKLGLCFSHLKLRADLRFNAMYARVESQECNAVSLQERHVEQRSLLQILSSGKGAS